MSVYGGASVPQSVPGKPNIDARKLWTGGIATALVAAGVAVVGFLVVRGLFNIPVLGVEANGATVFPSMFGYAAAAGVVALIMTGILHLLLLTTPRPVYFFGWIGGIATAIAVLVPLTLPMPIEARFATSVVNLAIGIAIGSLLSATASASSRTGYVD